MQNTAIQHHPSSVTSYEERKSSQAHAEQKVTQVNTSTVAQIQNLCSTALGSLSVVLQYFGYCFTYQKTDICKNMPLTY